MIKNIKRSDVIPALVTCLIVLTILLIPFRIMQSGFLPADDALRHHLGRIGSETTEGARQLAEVESWLDDHPIDVEGIIRRIHRTAIR